MELVPSTRPLIQPEAARPGACGIDLGIQQSDAAIVSAFAGTLAGLGRDQPSATRRALLDFFYPADAGWQRGLVAQSRETIGRALAFLGTTD